MTHVSIYYPLTSSPLSIFDLLRKIYLYIFFLKYYTYSYIVNN
jgi:hypothetical protein